MRCGKERGREGERSMAHTLTVVTCSMSDPLASSRVTTSILLCFAAIVRAVSPI